jgi:hypothetical protein
MRFVGEIKAHKRMRPSAKGRGASAGQGIGCWRLLAAGHLRTPMRAGAREVRSVYAMPANELHSQVDDAPTPSMRRHCAGAKRARNQSSSMRFS